MKKKKTVKKLVLAKETLKNLEAIALQEAAGGWTYSCPGVCYNTYTCGDEKNPCDR